MASTNANVVNAINIVDTQNEVYQLAKTAYYNASFATQAAQTAYNNAVAAQPPDQTTITSALAALTAAQSAEQAATTTKMSEGTKLSNAKAQCFAVLDSEFV